MKNVLTIGESMAVVIPERSQVAENAEFFRVSVGGAESNFAGHMAARRIPTLWASAVGDDALGRRLVRTLNERGIDTSLVQIDATAPTGMYVKDPAAYGSTVTYYRRGSAASQLGPEYAAGLPITSAALVHLSGITAALSDTCLALVDEVIDRRTQVRGPLSFDVNYRPALWESKDRAASVLLELARRASIVFVGRDEAELLWGTGTPREIHNFLKVPRLVVKDGEIGASLFEGGEEHFTPSIAVEVLEPVGAGDAFAAGFLAAQLRGADSIEALNSGHRSAAHVLTIPDDF